MGRTEHAGTDDLRHTTITAPIGEAAQPTRSTPGGRGGNLGRFLTVKSKTSPEAPGAVVPLTTTVRTVGGR